MPYEWVRKSSAWHSYDPLCHANKSAAAFTELCHAYDLMIQLYDIATKHLCPRYEFLSHPRKLTTRQMFRQVRHIGYIKSSYVTRLISKSPVWDNFCFYRYQYLQPKVILCFVCACAKFSQCQYLWASEKSGYQSYAGCYDVKIYLW